MEIIFKYRNLLQTIKYSQTSLNLVHHQGIENIEDENLVVKIKEIDHESNKGGEIVDFPALQRMTKTLILEKGG
jgi:fido (protein-threonine AMPylation protein)